MREIVNGMPSKPSSTGTSRPESTKTKLLIHHPATQASLSPRPNLIYHKSTNLPCLTSKSSAHSPLPHSSPSHANPTPDHPSTQPITVCTLLMHRKRVVHCIGLYRRRLVPARPASPLSSTTIASATVRGREETILSFSRCNLLQA